MRLATRILFGLSGFLHLAAVVYWTMSYTGTAQNRDPAGPALLAVAAVGFGYTGLVLSAAARRPDREAAPATRRPPPPPPLPRWGAPPPPGGVLAQLGRPAWGPGPPGGFAEVRHTTRH